MKTDISAISAGRSDIMGAVASGLCAIHCLATPVLFLVQSCSAHGCCTGGPAWWSAIDYLFIGITLFASYRSSTTTSSRYIKVALPLTWILLTALIVNEKLSLVPITAWAKYIAAFAMITLHMINLRHCRCEKESCCNSIPA